VRQHPRRPWPNATVFEVVPDAALTLLLARAPVAGLEESLADRITGYGTPGRRLYAGLPDVMIPARRFGLDLNPRPCATDGDAQRAVRAAALPAPQSKLGRLGAAILSTTSLRLVILPGHSPTTAAVARPAPHPQCA